MRRPSYIPHRYLSTMKDLLQRLLLNKSYLPFIVLGVAFLVFLNYHYTKKDPDIEKATYQCMQFDKRSGTESVLVCNDLRFVDIFAFRQNFLNKESSRLPIFTTNLQKDSVAVRMSSDVYRDLSLHLSARLNPSWLIQWNAWWDINIMGIPTLTFLFIGLFYLFFRQNTLLKREREIKGWLIQERENERLQIAQHLHDGPIQELQVLRMSFQGGLLNNQLNPKKVEEIENLQDQIEEHLRNVCYELRPPSLEHFGLDKNIEFLVDRLQKEHEKVQFSTHLMPEEPALRNPIKLVYYRTLQEGLRNALKHATPQHIKVEFKYESNWAILTISNDGLTFDVPSDWTAISRTGHFGMMDMQERARSVGAKLSITSKPESGTVLTLKSKV